MEPVTVREILRRDFIEVGLEAEPAEVFQLMAMARVRTLPVLEAGRLAGWVTFRDVAHAIAGREPPGSIAPLVRPATPVALDAPLAEAARHMVESDQPLVAATEPGAPGIVGLVTEGDLLRAAYLSSAR